MEDQTPVIIIAPIEKEEEPSQGNKPFLILLPVPISDKRKWSGLDTYTL